MSGHGIDMTVDEVRDFGSKLNALLAEKSPEELKAMSEKGEMSEAELEMIAGGITDDDILPLIHLGFSVVIDGFKNLFGM